MCKSRVLTLDLTPTGWRGHTGMLKIIRTYHKVVKLSTTNKIGASSCFHFHLWIRRRYYQAMTSLANGVSAPRSVQLQDELRSTKDELSKVMETLKSLQLRKKELDEKIGSLKNELKILNETQSSWTKYEDESFSWSEDMRETLTTVFGIDDFRSYQKAAINATMSGLDVILIMPTGETCTIVLLKYKIFTKIFFKILFGLLIFRRRQVFGVSTSSSLITRGHVGCLTTNFLDGGPAPITSRTGHSNGNF